MRRLSLRFESLNCPYRCQKVKVLRSLPEKDKMHLAGNAFNMEVVTALTMFLLANMIDHPVTVPQTLQPLESATHPTEAEAEDWVRNHNIMMH